MIPEKKKRGNFFYEGEQFPYVTLAFHSITTSLLLHFLFLFHLSTIVGGRIESGEREKKN